MVAAGFEQDVCLALTGSLAVLRVCPVHDGHARLIDDPQLESDRLVGQLQFRRRPNPYVGSDGEGDRDLRVTSRQVGLASAVRESSAFDIRGWRRPRRNHPRTFKDLVPLGSSELGRATPRSSPYRQ
jgi:hypothetical protein